MIFDWGKFLTLAEHLNSTIDSPESHRSSISRAYYSVFGKARVFCVFKLEILDIHESKRANCHQLLFDKLVDQDDEHLLEIANIFYSLKIRRQKADYDAFEDIRKAHATDTINQSNRVIKLMSDYVI